MQPATVALLLVAGAALVVQNTLMARMTDASGSVLVTLITNSAVGLVALVSLLMLRTGPAGFVEAFAGVRIWHLLPGLLGAFFVFASITGYQRLGAAPTIALLVASQLLFGLAFDMMRGTGFSWQTHARSLLGAGLLVLGAWLVMGRKGG